MGLNPLVRGWGEYYKRAHIRKLFQRLDGWIRRRIWSHRYWRNAGWKWLPARQLYGANGYANGFLWLPTVRPLLSRALRFAYGTSEGVRRLSACRPASVDWHDVSSNMRGSFRA